MGKPSSENAKRLKTMKRIRYNGHYETWSSGKKNITIPGKHEGKYGFVMDNNDNIVVSSTDNIVKKNKLVSTSCGQGKRYDTCKNANTVELYTNW